MDIALLCTDFHLQPNNLSIVFDIHRQAIQVAKDRGIKQHIWLGDIFESRSSQREETLNTLTRIIEMYDEEGHSIICIPGNHDKTDYGSASSFLDSYKYHPSFDLITGIDVREIKGVVHYFIPFFEAP